MQKHNDRADKRSTLGSGATNAAAAHANATSAAAAAVAAAADVYSKYPNVDAAGVYVDRVAADYQNAGLMDPRLTTHYR